MSERIFNKTPECALPPVQGPGAFIIKYDAVRATHSYEAPYVTTHVDWAPLADTNEHLIIYVQHEAKQLPAVVIQNMQSTPLDSVAADFAAHLRTIRSTRLELPDITTIVSIDPVEPPHAWVRTPHFMTLEAVEGVTDMPIWEYLTREHAQVWCGGNLPNQLEVEQCIPKLLKLRHEYRNSGHLPSESPEAKEIERRLRAGRYLSMLFVYQNYELFKAMNYEDQ